MTETAPKNCMVNPRDFGKETSCAWKSSLTSAQLATADAQHRFSIAARKAIKSRYGSTQRYCSETNQNYQHLSRVLRGEVILTFGDIATANEQLGISVELVGSERKDGGSHISVMSSTRNSLGAFYTPDDVAACLVRELSLSRDSSVLEPSFGDGAFLKALKRERISVDKICGCEIDPSACESALSTELLSSSMLFHGSFFDFDLDKKFDAVVGNPPFVRIRTLSPNDAVKVIEQTNKRLGSPIGEESSLWLPFLVKAGEHVKNSGGLAFVLPQDFTYLRYAKSAWEYLATHFGSIRLIRVKERIFKSIMQDVVLLVAKQKGKSTDQICFSCFDRIDHYLNGKSERRTVVSLDDILNDRRPFQRALIDNSVLAVLEGSSILTPSCREASFHIGYVSGNKKFFHPTTEQIEEFSIPHTSLVDTVVSSRQLTGVGYSTSQYDSPGKLWLPNSEPSEVDRQYIHFGEALKVDTGYKCRTRKPWWIVPGIDRPDGILTVFGDTPKMLLNDGAWAISNSLLGAYCSNGINPRSFCSTWYSSVTRLSIEMQVHSLGGGMLVAVPREANRVVKLASSHYDPGLDIKINERILAGNIDEAYCTYNHAIENQYGADFIRAVQKATEELIAWRKH
ncbi:N-6 DNA methylase [Collinsella sp. BA40]|uniref:Eco57I restriction-modification methylase domain-containing protein n=1 Tax=Collinsella sp. BA40 TaxID=2560852 RepID=UPI0011C77431|nr:N-6 DNA methylase [Collinsella sp. BA40]TXF35900.1 N-6 DNA methylase [Collinsella sp. BA40]